MDINNLKAGMRAVALGLAFVLTAGSAQARHVRDLPDADSAGGPMTVSIREGHPSVQIVVPAGKSQFVHFDRYFRQIVVGSKDIAEVVPLSHNSIYVLGRKRGTTNLTITNGSNGIIAEVDVVVTYDIDGLKRQLQALVPNANIDIEPAGDALVLSGHVNSADDLRTILAVADRYAPGQITNLLQVGGSQQVMLEVKFSEVERSAMQQLGLDFLNAGLTNSGSIASAVVIPQSAFGTVGGLLTDNKSFFLRAQITAMEQKGLVRTLAEPNLVALSGDTANFLAGGEFPIPVVQSSNGTVPTTTIEYKDFGVGLSFTPTVISAHTINLALKTEVSSIDKANSVTTNGIDVPGLKVRRTNTTVELRDGETFAIAGLIQSDFADSLNRLPGIGEIPVLGALFRSINYQHNESEMVVFITVHLVQPISPDKVALPTDRVQIPNSAELNLLGHLGHEVPPPPAPPPGAQVVPGPAPESEAAPQQTPGTEPDSQQSQTSTTRSEGYVLP